MNTRSSLLYGVGLDVETNRIQMQIVMGLQKKNDMNALRSLIANLAAQDVNGEGAYDFDAFTAGLAKSGIFLPVVDTQALMKHYNVGAGSDPKDRLIDYMAFAKGLRRPLEGRRLGITEAAWQKCAGDAEQMTVSKANMGEEYFEGWCRHHGVKEGDVVSKEEFMTGQQDLSTVIYEDDKYIGLVEQAWALKEDGHLKVHYKDTEALIAAIRLNLMKMGSEKHTEEFILREIFRQFDRDSNGVLSKNELAGMLAKMSLQTDDANLEALIRKFDRNGNGVIEFEEFQTFLVQDRYNKY